MLTKKQQELLLFIHQKLQEGGIPPSFDEMKDALELKSKSGIHRLITALEERGFIKRLANRARALEVIRLPHGYHDRQRMDFGTDTGADTGMSGFNEPGLVANLTPGDGVATGAKGQVENVSALARRGFTPSIIDGGLASDKTTLKSDSNVLSGDFGEAHEAIGAHVPVMGRIAAGVPISAIENFTHSQMVPLDMIGTGEHFALQVEGESMIEAGIHNGDTVICRKTDTATVGDIVVAFIDDEEATLKRFRRQGDLIALEAANPLFETKLFEQQRVKVQGRLVGLMRNYQ